MSDHQSRNNYTKLGDPSPTLLMYRTMLDLTKVCSGHLDGDHNCHYQSMSDHQSRNNYTKLGDPSPTLLMYRSEEHTSELQSRIKLVCCLLLEKENCSN